MSDSNGHKYIPDLTGVKGNSTIQNFEEKITLEGFSHLYKKQSPGDELGSSEHYPMRPNVHCSGLILEKKFDPSIPPILSSFTKGKAFDNAKLHCLTSDNVEYLIVDATDVVVEEVNMQFHDEASVEIVLSYDHISYYVKDGTRTLANFQYSKKEIPPETEKKR